MPNPTLAVQVAPGDAWNVESPTWVAVTADVRDGSLQWARGTSITAGLPQAGTLTFELNDTARDYDPDYASSSHYPDLVPMMQVRVTATHNSVTYDLWRGHVVEWRSELRGTVPVVVVAAVDGLAQLNRLLLPKSYDTVIAALTPIAFWKLDETTGTTAADSGSAGADGTYTNTPSLNQTGPMTGMGAVSFDDAASEYVAVGAVAGSNIAADWTIEGWVKFDDATAFSPVAQFGKNAGGRAYGLYAGSSGGALYWQLGYATGTGVNDFNAAFLSPNPSTSATWYHWALVFDASDAGWRFYLDGTESGYGLVAPADFSPGSVSAFSVELARRDTVGSTLYLDGSLARVTLHASALSATTEISSHANIRFNGFLEETTGTRVAAILDQVDWPAGLRTLSTGLTTVNADTPGQVTALAATGTAVDSEGGAAWVDGAGNLIFLDRDDLSSISAVTHSIGDSGEPGYVDATPNRSDLRLFTVAQVTDYTGDLVVAEDTTESGESGARVISLTTHTTDPDEPGLLAEALVGRHSAATTQVDGLTLTYGRDSSNTEWATLLGAELGDWVALTWTHPSGVGSATEIIGTIRELAVRQSSSTWTAVLRLAHPAAAGGTFTLDSPALGLLDSGVPWGW